jgi:preprotein translocase subunit SecE
MPTAKVKPLNFLKEVRSELKRVTWPSRQEAIRLTSVVIIVSALVGVYIGTLDYVFAKLIGLVLGR